MSYNYTLKEYNKEQMSRAISMLPISGKKSVEICNFIRNKNVAKAKKLLEGVIEKKVAVPFKRYNRGIPHRKVIGPGKFPIKACSHILQLINSAEANAQNKGLNSSNMLIKHLSVKKASQQYHTGRKRARKMKRCYVEIVLSEVK